jgi:hypothetical protein
MNSLGTAAARESLIFNWEQPRRRGLALGGFVVASLALHFATLYVFQVVYPPTVTLLPPPARVNLISPATEQGRTLLQWMEAEDPALVSTTRRPADMKALALPPVEHLPSYFAIEPALKEPPPLVADLRIPSARAPAMVPMARESAPQPPGSLATRVRFSPELDRFGPAKFPPASFTVSSTEMPQNPRYQVAVDSRGAVRYCFLLDSSGDGALDEQGGNYLALCRFSKAGASGDELIWGTAAIEWGNDVAGPKSTATPAKP